MKRFALVWFLLASSYAVASLLIDVFTESKSSLRADYLITLLCVTLAQAAVLQSRPFSPSRPHENPDQHR